MKMPCLTPSLAARLLMATSIAAGGFALAQPVPSPTLSGGDRPEPAPATPPQSSDQPTPGVPAGSAPVRPEFQPAPSQVDEREYLARSLVRTVLMDLRVCEELTADDYRLASMVLGVAESFQPNDADLVRRRLEAAFNSGQPDLVEACLRRLVILDPRDVVSQLRLITHRIQRLQTVDERLVALDRLLGSDGASLDASIRSRLALDAALLRREQGDTAGFVERLKQAVTLDSSNKEAASLALTFFSALSPDPVGALELLTNLLMADPIDPNLHLRLGRELASLGAYEEAARFHFIAQRLLAAGGSGDPAIGEESWCLIWTTLGAEELLRRLTDQIELQRQQARVEERRRADDIAAQPGARAEDLRLPAELERIRMTAAVIAGDTGAATQAVNDFAASVEQAFIDFSDPARLPPDISPDQARVFLRDLLVELQLFRAWLNLDLDKIIPDLERRREYAPSGVNAGVLAMQGWLELRAGERDKAVEYFVAAEQATSPEDVVISRLEVGGIGLASVAEDRGDRDAAVKIYRDVLARRPLQISGRWAEYRLKALGALGPEQEALAQRAAQIGASIPRFVDSMAASSRSYVSLELIAPSETLKALERAPLTIRVKNISSLPLAVGSDRPISTRVLVSGVVESMGATLRGGLDSEVFEIDRRLRLMPLEAMEVPAYFEVGSAGWTIESAASTIARIRHRAIQGFAPGAQGGLDVGAYGLTAECPAIIRQPIPEARLGNAALAAAIRSSGALADVVAAARARILSPGLDGQPLPLTEAEQLVAALVERFAAEDESGKILMIATLPNAAQEGAMTPFDDAALADTSPRVAEVAVFTRARSVESDAMTRALASEDPRLRQVAELMRNRLVEGRPSYSTRGAPRFERVVPGGSRDADASTP
ncbi:MAG: hypothetical protein SFZ23_02740 [Planctomycetota bacterium]|nr:hypothetical protein [Planctomycetota bacterium]